MKAQVVKLVADKVTGCLRQENLPSVARTGNARSAVDVHADVALLCQLRRTRMDADPDADWPGG